MSVTKLNKDQVTSSIALDEEVTLTVLNAVNAHIADPLAHPSYDNSNAPVQSVNAKTGDVIITKTDIGLNNVDNTSDINKPISTAVQSALDTKVGQAAIDTAIQNLVGSAPGALDTIQEIAAALNNEASTVQTLTDNIAAKANSSDVTIALSNKADLSHSHSTATTSVNGFMSSADKTKLDGVANSANNYTHPANHLPSIISQDSGNRFVSDTEKATWNGKQNNLGYTPENSSNKGIANGYTPLDSGLLVPISYLPVATSVSRGTVIKGAGLDIDGFGTLSLNSQPRVNGLNITSDASVSMPTGNDIALHSMLFSQKPELAYVDAIGRMDFLQRSLYSKNIVLWAPASGTAVSIAYGTTWIARNAGAGSAQSRGALAETNNVTSMTRSLFGTGTTTTGSSGTVSTDRLAFLSTVAGKGGFFFYSRFALETYLSTQQFMVGLSSVNSALAGQPSAIANFIGIGKDSSDNTLQFLTRNASTGSKINTLLTPDPFQVYDLYMYAVPGSNSVKCALVSPTTNNTILYSTIISSNQPAVNTELYVSAQIRSTTGTTAKTLALSKMYLETDY